MQFLAKRRRRKVIPTWLLTVVTVTGPLAAVAFSAVELAHCTFAHALIDPAIDRGFSFTELIDRFRIWDPEMVNAA